ncbi:PIN domain-containing protein [Trichothermofontia sp.]
MRIYLDTSIYNRPFDDQTQVKIFLETQASISIFRLIAQKTIILVNSPILERENQRNPSPIRQQFMQSYLEQATLYQPLTPLIIERARHLQSQGLKNFDALHIAAAEAAQCYAFLTCDRRLINRCKDLILKVMNPVDYILEIEDENPE